jgi:hypothetical protein
MDGAPSGYRNDVTDRGPAPRRFAGRRSTGPRAPRPFREPRPYPRRLRRGRFGMWGPIPYYSTRTRRGDEVSVGGCGCCLPILLLAGLGLAGLGRVVVGAVRRRRVLRRARSSWADTRTAADVSRNRPYLPIVWNLRETRKDARKIE